MAFCYHEPMSNPSPYIDRREELLRLCQAAHGAALREEQPSIGEYQAERWAEEIAEEQLYDLENSMRKVILEEELELLEEYQDNSSRDLEDMNRRLIKDEHESRLAKAEAEDKLLTARADIRKEILISLSASIKKSIYPQETIFDGDVEKWAYKDGWNDSLDRMFKLLADDLSD